MIQPYFDPTVSFQGGSIFSQYLQGFVKERSAMNKQLMEMALSRSDPGFLQDQITLLNKNILELEKAKAKASTGNTGDALAYAKLYANLQGIESRGRRDLALEAQKQGGRAKVALDTASDILTLAQDNINEYGNDISKAVKSIAAQKDLDQLEREALAIQAAASNLGINAKTAGLPSTNLTAAQFRQIYGSPGAYDIPSTASGAAAALKFGRESVGSTPEQRAASTANIDAAIAAYQTKLKKYEQQLVDLEAGGGDVFSGFSRNYMLDNPFIQMSRQQGAVDALAAAVEESSKEDYTVPYSPRVEREAAQVTDRIPRGEPVFEGGTFSDYYTKRVDEEGNPLKPNLDADQLAILNMMGVRNSTTQRIPDFTFSEPESEEPVVLNITGGPESVAEQNINNRAERPAHRDPVSIVSRNELGEPLSVHPQPQTRVSDAAIAELNLQNIGSGIGGQPPGEEQVRGETFYPPQPLTAAVRESNLFSADPLLEFIVNGQIIEALSEDGTEFTYTPYSEEARDAILRQIRHSPGPAETAFEVFPR